MELLYNERNAIKLSRISQDCAVPRQFKAKIEQCFGKLIEYEQTHFRNNRKHKQSVCDALNILMYCVIAHEPVPFDWSISDPLRSMPEYDMTLVEDTLSQLFITIEGIDWDIPESNVPDVVDIPATPSISSERQVILMSNENISNTPKPPAEVIAEYKSAKPIDTASFDFAAASKNFKPAVSPVISSQSTKHKAKMLSDIMIGPVKIPSFDATKVWYQPPKGFNYPTMFVSLPEVPEVLSDIGCSTNIELMIDSDFMHLFPDNVIRTRPSRMYEEAPGLDFDPVFGCIPRIDGFTKDEVLDNIIKYPLLPLNLKRDMLDETTFPAFADDIEVDGELFSTLTVWGSLPESKVTPPKKSFIREYVVRRYLLERDRGISHNYEMYGVLQPFTTLVMPPEMYIQYGYKDPLAIAKEGVKNRIAFYRSVNPIINGVSNKLGYQVKPLYD